MAQMKVIADCCPIPAVLNGVDQNQFGREYMLTAPSVSSHKKRKPRTVDVVEVKRVTFMNDKGEKQTIPAVVIPMNGKNLFYPGHCFVSVQ